MRNMLDDDDTNDESAHESITMIIGFAVTLAVLMVAIWKLWP